MDCYQVNREVIKKCSLRLFGKLGEIQAAPKRIAFI